MNESSFNWGIILNVCLWLSVLGSLSYSSVTVSATSGKDDARISPCENGTYISVAELLRYCGVPAPCWQPLDCEGRIALVTGVIDYRNLWEKSKYPWLPFDRFFMRDQPQGIELEIRVASHAADGVFREIHAHRGSQNVNAFVEGTLVGIDLPFMDGCRRELVLLIPEESTIDFYKEQ